MEWLFERLASWGEAEAIVQADGAYTYAALRAAVRATDVSMVQPGDVVLLRGDYSLRSIALLLALLDRRAIVAPVAPGAQVETATLAASSRAQWLATEGGIARSEGQGEHALYDALRSRGAPGLVIFTSGSSGQPKSVVHDVARIVEKFVVPKPRARTLSFLLFDHIGGFNTLMQTLASGGTLVIPGSHDPEIVASMVARHRVELLPVTPTFLNLMLLNGAHTRHDLSSLRVVSYGTEPMPDTTLARAVEALPGVRFHQLYGMSELGILRSKSRGPWVQLGGDGVEVRVVDGLLQVKSASAMLGYLDAPSPFTEDGWLITGDQVEVDGDWIRIQGRRSELINVGGQKVFPAEVENVIAALDNVTDVTVYGEAHALMGHVVVCKVNLAQPEDPKALKLRLRKHCRTHLAEYKVPVRVEVTEAPLYSARMKRLRAKAES